MSRECYLCYDIKGIQQFIFSVPKLKYVVGASLLIDEFDRKAGGGEGVSGAEAIFTGGGKGTFSCNSEQIAENLREKLVKRAHENGLDLRIGINAELSEATRHADDLYPFVPDSLDGEPCYVSRLWPVTEKNGVEIKGENNTSEWIHPLIDNRAKAVRNRSERKLDTDVLNAIRTRLPEDLLTLEAKYQTSLEFLTVVGAEAEMEPDEKELAQAADAALGNRNRWAVLSLDGNDMGCQFRAFEETKPSDEKKKTWMTAMSGYLRQCTREAFYEGLTAAITAWWEKAKENQRLLKLYDQARTVVLPFRLLILGGDDILCLCHSSWAMTMAETIIETFHAKSKEVAQDAQKKGIEQLWPGTGGELTISAGIAYTGVTLPLFLSIPYAESLLGSAKAKFRKDKKDGGPTPAAVDWESITESMLDTPSARRRRDLSFKDKDLDKEIVLTMRPYRVFPNENKPKETTLQNIEQLKAKLSKIPRSVLTELMTVLTLPWGERVGRLTAMAVQNPKIMEWLDDGITDRDKLGSCWVEEENNKRCNWFLDALLLLEEEKRMEKETVR